MKGRKIRIQGRDRGFPFRSGFSLLCGSLAFLTPTDTLAAELHQELDFWVESFPSEAIPETLPEAEVSDSDPELGTLRLEAVERPEPPGQSSAYLFGWTGYTRSSNVFAEVDPIDDGLWRSGLTALALKEVTPTTTLFVSAGGGTNRYQSFSAADYASLTLNAGASQKLSDRASAEVGWLNQHLFSRNESRRFLKSHTFYLQLRRQDPIAPQLNLETAYRFDLSFADPDARSQTLHNLKLGLNYTPLPRLELGLESQFIFANFTRIDRRDRYYELLARLSYQLTPRSTIELYGGRSFGGSSDPEIEFNNWIFGIGLEFILF